MRSTVGGVGMLHDGKKHAYPTDAAKACHPRFQQR
jgi:hypothetical protein